MTETSKAQPEFLSPRQASFISDLSADNREFLRGVIKQYGRFFVAFESVGVSGEQPAVGSRTSLGGGFRLPFGVERPVDESTGEYMVFLGQVDFSQLPLELSVDLSGTLLIFASRNYMRFRNKDRKWLKCLWLTASNSEASSEQDYPPDFPHRPIRLVRRLQIVLPENSSDSIDSQFLSLAHKFNQVSEANHGTLFYDSLQARVIAAFYANGVSHSPAREQDSHFQHLVRDAGAYLSLWSSDIISLVNSEEKRALYICAKPNDLITRAADKFLPILL